MSSPAGHCTLHGGSLSTYKGRFVRQLPVLLASDEPGSSVIAKGLSITPVPRRVDGIVGYCGRRGPVSAAASRDGLWPRTDAQSASAASGIPPPAHGDE